MVFPLKSKQLLTLILLFLCAICASLFASLIGGFQIEFLNILSGQLSDLETEVLLGIRIPRILLALIVGATLGISGAALQGLFRNPLADPALIGVSAGAALGAVSGIVISDIIILPFELDHLIIPSAATAGSLIVIAVIYALTRGFRQSEITYMLLIGIALNALATVGIGFLTFISTDSQLRGLSYWMMGSFGAVNWNLLLPAAIIVSAGCTGLILIAHKLDILQLGEIEAWRVGLNVKKIKMAVILVSSFMIGISVSLSGIIGFVGLVVPHLVRLLAGTNHTYLLAGSALMGITITVLADLFSRVVISPAELPVGLATSALGAPFFLFLIIRLKKIEY